MRKINLVFVCDRLSIKRCCVSMYSALINKNKTDYICFYFIADDSFKDSDFKVFEILRSDESSVKILYADPKLFALYRETTRRNELPVNAYYRLGIPWLLPSEDKAIYIDYDTIILKSLWEIYSLNITDYYLAAVEDVWKYKRAEELKRYCREMRHYNSGMMVINLKKWREEHINDKFISFAKTHKKVFALADQFLVNTIINKNVKYLDFSWNLQSPRSEFKERVEYDDIVAFNNAKNYPAIIHYNFRKPWSFYDCRNPFFDLWWLYARQLPFYESLLIEGILSSLKS